jgi:hypothetical protein
MNVSLRGALLRALSIQGVPEKRRKWCLGWVDQFERKFPERPLQHRTREEVEDFITTLRSRGVEPWQISQAEATLRLLYYRVLGESWAQSWMPSSEGSKVRSSRIGLSGRPSCLKSENDVKDMAQSGFPNVNS